VTQASTTPANMDEASADRRMLIDGQLVETERTFPSLNPATGEVLGYAPEGTVADAEAAVAAARRAFDTGEWATNVDLRIRCLAQFHRALIDHREELAALTIAEVGATPALTQGAQLDQPIEIVRYYAELLKTYPLTEDLGNIESRGMQHHRWVEKEAGGVVAAIIAYNYPNQLALAKLAPALAAGCTVVLKSAPDTPLITLALGELIANHTDIPAGVVNVLSSSDPAVGAVLTTSPDVDMVTFTGSEGVGVAIMQQAAPTLKRVHLELGGKSALIVRADADVQQAAIGAVAGLAVNCGQGCALLTRFLVHNSIRKQFVEMAQAVAAQWKIGDPADPAVLMGPLIRESQRAKVERLIRQGRDEGARLVFGGGRPAHLPKGFFTDITLFDDVENRMAIAQEEVFGPVGVTIGFDSDDEAIAIANDSRYGLNGGILSADAATAYEMSLKIRAGSVYINGGTGKMSYAPIGGYKRSGIGREYGPDWLKEFTQEKSIFYPVGR
jgi:aldehyde dehydrogenase (NAD+)